MASKVVKTLGVFKRLSPFDRGIAKKLPVAYKKFYKEWKETEPATVNTIPVEARWVRDDLTNEVKRIQNVPIPMKYPAEYDHQIWGGEGVIQGFQKRDHQKRRVPHFWVPTLHRSVVYSVVLNKHISVIVTERTIKLINDNYGFDHYLLKTPACDLKSLLPLGIKRKILQELQNGCPAYNECPEKQKEILSHYQQYLNAYTPEEIEWYGYSLKDACKRIKDQLEAVDKPVPLKMIYRANLIEKLNSVKIKDEDDLDATASTSWIKKINPFAKKQET